MTGPRRFDPAELGSDRQDEVAGALAAARGLDAAANLPPVSPSSGFADRVMAAIAHEPAPAPAGFLAPLHRRGLLGGFVASVRQAWLSVGGGGRPILVRASALAYVFAVVLAGTSLIGAATVGVAGALGIFEPRPTQSAPPETPGPSLVPEPTIAPAPSDQPSGESEPPQSEDPSESPDGSDDHGGNSGPGSSDSGSDDSSGPSSTSSGSDDGSGSDGSDSGSDGSGSGSTSTPRPSDTPRPTGTPKPSETPH